MQLKCCGFYNFTDFGDSPYFKNHNNTYPPQCCGYISPCNQTVAYNKVCTFYPHQKNNIHTQNSVKWRIRILPQCFAFSLDGYWVLPTDQETDWWQHSNHYCCGPRDSSSGGTTPTLIWLKFFIGEGGINLLLEKPHSYLLIYISFSCAPWLCRWYCTAE